MIGIAYFAVVLLACVLGAIVGLGGGVLIRPIFDTIAAHDMANIQFFSSAAILSMAVVSTVMKVRDGTEIDRTKALLISAGALAGGVLGDMALLGLLSAVEEERTAQLIQSGATVAMLLLSLVLTALSGRRCLIKSKWLSFPFGICLGAVAVFLGVGGGPVNVPLLMIFFGLSIKTAAAYSIVIIFFSHFSRLATMGATVGFAGLSLPMLPFILPAALLGGFAGARVSKRMSDGAVKKVFLAAISAVTALNIANGFFLL